MTMSITALYIVILHVLQVTCGKFSYVTQGSKSSWSFGQQSVARITVLRFITHPRAALPHAYPQPPSHRLPMHAASSSRMISMFDIGPVRLICALWCLASVRTNEMKLTLLIQVTCNSTLRSILHLSLYSSILRSQTSRQRSSLPTLAPYLHIE